MRLWNGLPVYFFDEGHAAHLFKPLLDAGLEHYYLDRPPMRLDIEQPLDAVELTKSEADFRRSADYALRRLAQLPTPAGMIAAIKRAK